jgi:hypothetical protein
VTPGQADQAGLATRWAGWPADAIRLVVAPVVLFFSGFVTADFMVSGAYTWPRTSRILILTLTVAVLAYEFVYKEHRAPYRALLYSCLIPYAAGTIAVLALLRLI